MWVYGNSGNGTQSAETHTVKQKGGECVLDCYGIYNLIMDYGMRRACMLFLESAVYTVSTAAAARRSALEVW